ncbi:hypothetical protein C8Q73DRAFT_332880 [Cubamyces lactineus]|nr:hypothetical protein C8Q73DRAFT_332880 [Cubamyces lactineus]
MSLGLHSASHLLSTIDEVASSVASPASNSPPMHDDSDDEEFIYPDAETEAGNPAGQIAEAPVAIDSPVVHRSPPRASTPTPDPLVQQPQLSQSSVLSKSHPSAAQLEALHAAAASGDLRRIQTEFRKAVRTDDVDPFELANDASPRTGLTALHAAASRGYLDIVKWRTYASIYLSVHTTEWLRKSWRIVAQFRISKTKRARPLCIRLR